MVDYAERINRKNCPKERKRKKRSSSVKDRSKSADKEQRVGISGPVHLRSAENCREDTAFGLQQRLLSPGIQTSSHTNLPPIALNTWVSLRLPCLVHAILSLRNVFFTFTSWKSLAQVSKPSCVAHLRHSLPRSPRMVWLWGPSESLLLLSSPWLPLCVHCGHREEFSFRTCCP